MLTQCPACETAFKINTAILRAANGQVRCGRCRTQFDALDRLLDDEGTPLSRLDQATMSDEFLLSDLHGEPEPEPEPAASADSLFVEEPPAQEQITLEGQRVEITGTYRVVADDAATGHEQLVRQTYVIDSAVPDDPVADESKEVEEPPVQTRTPAPHESTSQMRARRIEEEDAAMLRAAQRRTADVRDNVREVSPAVSPLEIPAIEQDLPLFGAPPPRTRAGLLWKIALGPLIVLLIAQYVHHERADLARHPTIGPALTSLYSALGATIDPNWNIAEYDLKQRGVIADPAAPGTLTVRASITNLADVPQPYPLLKLVLEDRWGNAVRARAFSPQEYTVIADARSLMAPGQRADARVAIADPGKEAEGFRFDLCLPRTSGMTCAEDAPARRH